MGTTRTGSAIRLNVEDQVELGRLLVGQRPADLETGRMDHRVEASVSILHVSDHGRHLLTVPQVHGVVVGDTARGLRGLDGPQRRLPGQRCSAPRYQTPRR